MQAVAGINWRDAQAPSESEFSLGFEASPDGLNSYVRFQASGDVALGAAVRIDGDFQATELNEAMVVRSKTIGVSPVAAPEDQYFWAQVYGRSFVRAGNNATGAQIYASSTAGLVDDSGTTRINGLSLTGVASSAGALVACALTRPKSDRT